MGCSVEFSHASVMPAEVLSTLNCRAGGVYLDGTLGGGGHAAEILKATGPDGFLIGIDRDSDALRAAAKVLAPYKGRFHLVKNEFRNMKSVIEGLGVVAVDGIVLDLGVSSYQFDTPERGFSFRLDGRLDMRMDADQALSAYDIVNGSDRHELDRIFREYGEERHSWMIAGAICRARAIKPIETTGELAAIILAGVPKKLQSRDIHPATRVFQALRIEVNDELGGLEQGLAEGVKALKAGGRIVVISFHSLEDRIVKNMFKDLASSCVCPPRIPMCVCGKKAVVRIVTKKALTPSEGELGRNPRARSAKLRAAEKI